MISIIVPCKNRIEKLTLCLNSINNAVDYASKRTKPFGFEIMVVNNESDEGFREHVNGLFPTIKIVDSDGMGPGNARNVGIRNTKGQFIFFTDSDCIVAENWILEGISFLTESRALVVQGVPWLFQKNENIYFGNQEQNLYEMMFSTYLYDGNKTKMTDSRNLLMNRDITKVLGDGVFAEKIAKATAESRVFGNLCLDHHIEMLFDENLYVYHEDPKSIEDVCRQKYRHGSGRIMIWKRIPSFEFLEERYFAKPLQGGLDKNYVLPTHCAFLLGYFQTLNDGDKYQEFMAFVEYVFKKHGKSLSDYEIIRDMIKEYER